MKFPKFELKTIVISNCRLDMTRQKYTLESLREFAKTRGGKCLSEKYVKASDSFEVEMWKGSYVAGYHSQC